MAIVSFELLVFLREVVHHVLELFDLLEVLRGWDSLVTTGVAGLVFLIFTLTFNLDTLYHHES
jgi:hypothetical protein